MAQYSRGRVIVTNASQTVDAAWEAYIQGFSGQLALFSTLHFNPSGARATVFSHTVQGGLVVFGLIGASLDPALGDAVSGATQIPARSALTTLATPPASDWLEDDTAGWVDDQHNGKWVIINPGLVGVEWRRIIDTVASSNRLILDVDLPAGIGLGDSYVIYNSQTTSLTSFKAGTPVDWVASGIVPGDEFSATPEPPFYVIGSVDSRQLTLSSNFVLNNVVEGRGVTYAIHRDFTPGKGLALISAGDTQLPSLLRRNALLLDSNHSRLSLSANIATTALDSSLNYIPFGSVAGLELGGRANGPGSALNTLEDDDVSWTNDEHNDRYVVLDHSWGGTDIAAIKSQVQKIVDTRVGPPQEIEVEEAWVFPIEGGVGAAGERYRIWDIAEPSLTQDYSATDDWIKVAPFMYRWNGTQRQRFRWHLGFGYRFSLAPAPTHRFYSTMLVLGVDDDRYWSAQINASDTYTHQLSLAGEIELWPNNVLLPVIYAENTPPQGETISLNAIHILVEAI